MNFVPRTSLRWVPESRVGGSKEIESEEIEYERKYEIPK